MEPIGEVELITRCYRRLIELGQFETSPYQTEHNLHLKQVGYITEDGHTILYELQRLCEAMKIELKVELRQ